MITATHGTHGLLAPCCSMPSRGNACKKGRWVEGGGWRVEEQMCEDRERERELERERERKLSRARTRTGACGRRHRDEAALESTRERVEGWMSTCTSDCRLRHGESSASKSTTLRSSHGSRRLHGLGTCLAEACASALQETRSAS